MNLYNLLSSIMAREEDHRRFRKLQSHAFSDKALAQQEVFLQSHLRAFINGLQRQVRGPMKGLVSISDWFNLTTFDLIGDLAFGHSFNGVEKEELHPWVKITFNFIKVMEYMRCTRIFPQVAMLLDLLIPKSLKQVRVDHARFSADRAQERMALKTDRNDFMSYLVEDGRPKGMTIEELNENAGILVLAGSETVSFLSPNIHFEYG
jgi:aspirochlorine biosynthesis cytochrome P450 monooxygenase